MTIHARSLFIAALALIGLLVSAMLPRHATELAQVGAAYPEAPPIHASVPTEPFRSH